MKTMKHGAARLVSMLLTLTMVLGLLPASALAAEPAANTVTFSVETRTVNGGCLVEPAQVELQEGDTPYTILEREAARHGLVVENTTGTYVTRIGDFSAMDEAYGPESGWMVAVNNDRDTWPLPELKNGDSVRFCYTYKTYGHDIDLMDQVDLLRANVAAAELKLASNEGNPFQEAEGYLEDENSKFNQLSLQYSEAYAKLETIDAHSTNMEYLDSVNIWGQGSELDALTQLNNKLAKSMEGGVYIPVTKIQLTSSNTKDSFTVGTYQFSAELTPADATIQEGVWNLVLITGEGYITADGLLTVTKPGMMTVQYIHPDGVLGTLFVKAEEAPVVDSARLTTLLNNIADASVDATDEWTVMDMGAYQLANPEGAKLTDKARQEYVNYAVNSLTTGSVDEAKIFKAILALRSQGVDPTRLTPYGLEGTVNAYELLTALDLSDSTWKAPYSLAAFHAADPTHELYKEKALPLLKALLENQEPSGAWNEWGTVDTTANAIAALALYPEVEGVSAAIQNGLNYLSSLQDGNGAFGKEPGVSWGNANSNSSALVVVALAAAGVDMTRDSRFIKNGNTALDGLMSFALADNSGFGYTDNKSLNDFSTEQCLRALVPAVKAMETGKACNVYDFSGAAAEPAAADGRSEHMDVDFEGDKQQMTIEGVSEKLFPVVNGQVVKKSIHSEGNLLLVLDQDCTVDLKLLLTPVFADVKGDAWYADAVSFGAVRELFAGVGEGKFAPEENLSRAQAVTMLRNLEEGVAEADAPFTDLTQDWYKAPVAWAAETGVAAGVGQGKFAPDADVTRQELAQMMYNYAKSQGMDVSVKGDLKNFKDADETASWAVEAMTWAVENGVMSGDGLGHLLPSATATRAQTAAMLENLTTMLVLETVA